MGRARYLRNAPITEALFDFRVALPAEFDTEKLGAAHSQLRDRYPLREELRQFQAIFEIKTGKQVAQQDATALLGYIFKTADSREIAQFRRDGFTFSRLAKYSAWDQLAPEALRLWTIYASIAKPEKVERLALRYINRLKLPSHGQLEDYLEIAPPRFPGAPEFMASFPDQAGETRSRYRVHG